MSARIRAYRIRLLRRCTLWPFLPDGGIAFTFRTHSWQGPGVAISYDEGRSFDYILTGPFDTVNAFGKGKDEFVVFTFTNKRSDGSAGVYRWVPNEP